MAVVTEPVFNQLVQTFHWCLLHFRAELLTDASWFAECNPISHQILSPYIGFPCRFPTYFIMIGDIPISLQIVCHSFVQIASKISFFQRLRFQIVWHFFCLLFLRDKKSLMVYVIWFINQSTLHFSS